MTAVTVAVPVFNGARFLATTLESLLAQDHPDFGIVVIDDGSTDDSLAVARSFNDPRLRVQKNESRLGLSGNWNAAFSQTVTPLLVIAHQDDTYDPAFLSVSERLLEKHPRAFISHTRAQYIDEHGRPLHSAASHFKDRFWPEEEPYERDPAAELRILNQGNYLICPAVMYRMSAVAEIGTFSEHLRFVPDWEYWFRGLLNSFTIVGTHARLIGWRRHAESTTRREEATLRRYDEELELLEWLSQTTRLPAGLRAVENTILSDFAGRLARGDREGAAMLRRFADERLPRSIRLHGVMQFGAFGGRAAGYALQRLESVYARFARPQR